MKVEYEATLKFFGENLNSAPSDTEFWAGIANFMDKFGSAQKALLAVRLGLCLPMMMGSLHYVDGCGSLGLTDLRTRAIV